MPFMPARVLLGGVLVSVSFAVLSPQPAQANDFTTCGSPTTLSVGDKTISNIVCTGLNPATSIFFSNFGVDYAFSTGFPQTQSASISYTIAINPLNSLVFSTVGLDSGCNQFGSAPNTCTVIKTVQDQFNSTLLSLTSTNGSNVTPAALSGDHKILNIVDTIAASGNATVSTVNNNFTQRPARAPVDSVPGPVPLLGGAAAFGFSRRLRNRIRQSSFSA